MNGQPLTFQLDTGFDSAFSIGESDARRLGLDTARLALVLSETANGLAKAAWVRCKIEIGGRVLRDCGQLVSSASEFAGVGTGFLQHVHLKISNGTARLSW